MFGDRRFERLAYLSSAHLYNLRRSKTYRTKRTVWRHTKPTATRIGERRRPRPAGQPGFVRVDTVHQGDRDGVKGTYAINLIDEVTQFEHIGAVARDRRGVFDPRDGRTARHAAVRRAGLPCGQRLRIHQSPRSLKC